MRLRVFAFGLLIATVGVVETLPAARGQQIDLVPLERLAQADGQFGLESDAINAPSLEGEANGPDTTPSTTDTIEPYAPAYAADVPSGKPKNPAANAFKGLFYDNRLQATARRRLLDRRHRR